MKIKLLFILLLLTLTIYPYNRNTHQYAVRESYNLLKNYLEVSDIPAMAEHLGGYQVGINKFIPGGLLVIGAAREDEEDIVYNNRGVHTTCNHFWDPDRGDGSKFCSQPDNVCFDNAYEKATKLIYGGYDLIVPYEGTAIVEVYSAPANLFEFYKTGIIYYKGCYNALGEFVNRNYWCEASMEFRNKVVWEIIGRVCHLLADVSVPAHSHNDQHDPYVGGGEDGYETYMEDNGHFDQWTYNSAIAQGGLINVIGKTNPLKYLFYSTAQIANHFPSDDDPGNNINDLGDPFSSYPEMAALMSTLGNPPSVVNSYQIGGTSYTFCLRATAGFLYWCAKEMNIIPPICNINILYNYENDSQETVSKKAYVNYAKNITVPLTITKTNRVYKFAGWPDNFSETVSRTLTPAGETSFNVLYKLENYSNNTSGFKYNSQKKLVRTNDGYLHKVYESMGYVWYEKSTDNGATWSIQNNGKPLSEKEAKLPSIDKSSDTYNAVSIVWQENNNSGYKIRGANTMLPGSSLYIFDIFDNNLFITTDYSFNTAPVVSWSGDKMIVIWSEKSGLAYKYYTASPYTIPVWHEQLSGIMVPGTDANSSNPTIAMRKDGGTLMFHLAWQQGNTSACAIKYCAVTANSSNAVSFSSIETPSTGDGFNDNRYPSISVISDYPTIVWEGRTYYGSSAGQATIISKTSAGWGSSFNKYGNNVNSPTAYNGIITWSEGSQSYTDKMFRYGSIKTLTTTGKYLQLSNGPNTSSMYAVAHNSSSPYNFQTTANLGSIAKENQVVNYSGRQGIVKKGNAQLYFTLADVTIDNEPVAFKELQEDLNVKNYSDFNSYLSTASFNITDDSKLTFSLSSGFTDSLATLTELKNDSELEFFVELVDVNSSEVIGNTEKIKFNKDNISAIDAKTYQLSTKGSGSRTVRLRIVSSSNFEADYYFANILNDADILAKSNVEELAYTGSTIITSYDLMQNYPNPFNPSTTISYQLPKDGMVTLKIYDAIGTEVTTLVNEYKPTGRYNVTFNAANLASGVYFYRLQVNDFTSSKKLILMK